MEIAVVMPIGPGPRELERCQDTVRSITRWEPAVRWLVLIDDSPEPRVLTADDDAAATGVDRVRLDHPLAAAASVEDRVTAAVLAGLRWVSDHTGADVVMKIDTDALVIAPFADKLAGVLSDPAVGLVGAYERSCTGQVREFAPWVPLIERAERLVDGRRLRLGRRRRRVRRVLREARSAGYRPGEHVLACALAMPRRALDAIVAGGGLDDPLTFVGTGLFDDPVLGVLVRRAGYRLAGSVGRGDTFGVAWQGLPDTPEGLRRRGYSIIHSVKNDRRVSEAAVRRFFAALRQT